MIIPSNVAGSYTPAWWIPGAHLQTLWGKIVRRPSEVPTRIERWATPDGDELELRRLEARPEGGVVAPRLVLLHGLEGTIHSHYIRGMLASARRLGWAADVLIFRGCNGVIPRARRMYHSGEMTDLDFVVRRVTGENPDQPLVLAGFSLGGNVLLKWLGEQGSSAPAQVRAAAAVSTPFDLERGSRHIERGFSRVYANRFLQSLRLKALAKLARDPGLFDADGVRTARTLFDFDDAVTAPLHGFAGASDYYTRSSSRAFLPSIRVPTLLLNARDDPFLPRDVLEPVAMMARSNHFLTVDFPEHGGHVGFVAGHLPWHPEYYAETSVLEFLASHMTDSTLSARAGAA